MKEDQTERFKRVHNRLKELKRKYNNLRPQTEVLAIVICEELDMLEVNLNKEEVYGV